MTAAEAIAAVARVGGRLLVDRGQLRLRAPAGAVGGELKAALRAHRAELLELLGRAAQRHVVEPDSDEEREILAASDRRERLAREAARTRLACGTGLLADDRFAELRDRYLVAGKPIGEAMRLARAETGGGGV